VKLAVMPMFTARGVIAMRRILSVVLISVLAGCGVAAKVRARNDMEVSKAAYKECLRREKAECEGLRQAYDADLQAYRATSNALRNGPMVVMEHE
jgi:hypothetical protein